MAPMGMLKCNRSIWTVGIFSVLTVISLLAVVGCDHSPTPPINTNRAEVPESKKERDPLRNQVATDVTKATGTSATFTTAAKSPVANNPKTDNPQPDDTKKTPEVAPSEKPDQPDESDGPPFKHRVLAPSLEGGVAWLNTKSPVDLKDLKGKWVMLDFWTYCCINCMHILPELNKLEKAHPNDLVVIGVHSAKFDAEQDSKRIQEAVLRYEIEHPVVNDAEHAIWDRFGVRAWPTLAVIDPEGYVVVMQSAETPWEVLDEFIKNKTPYYERKGLMNRTPIKFDLEAAKAQQTPLRFPGKILADEASSRLFIADSNHNRIVVCNLDGTNATTIGSGSIGKQDGDFATAQFHHPQGMALKDQTLYVADTENHLLRKIDLTKKTVVTIAGVGRQARSEWPGLDLDAVRKGEGEMPDRFFAPPLKTALNSPWDVWVYGTDLYIAMAGPHQIWKMPLDESEIGVYAGNGREDIVDGPTYPIPYERGFASFAQPSGLTSDGTTLFVADSEGSSIRAVPFKAEENVTTIVGTANLMGGRLFRFGDTDGKGDEVRLQHCLGVTYHDGLIYIADTYNNKVKVLNPKEESVRTIAGNGKPTPSDEPAQFNQPAGLSYAGGKLFIADTNNHLIRTIDLQRDNKVTTLEIKGLKAPEVVVVAAVANADDKPSFPNATEVKVAPVTLKAKDGKIQFAVKLKLPTGFKINPLAPMRYYPEPVAEKGPLDRAGLKKPIKVDPPSAEFAIALPAIETAGSDELKISLNYNYCQAGTDGECKFGSVIWTIPLKLSTDAESNSAPLEFEVP